MARKKKHEEHENHERWLISYADFITLLFAFFVVMYSISAINEGKFRVLSESLVAAFRSQPKSLEPVQVGSPSKAPIAQRPPIALPMNMRPQPAAAGGSDGDGAQAQAIQQIAEALEQAMRPLIDSDLISVRRDKLWLEVEIKASVLFSSGSAVLQTEAIPVLDKIAAILHEHPNPIRIEGFTDDRPINTPAFPSNWELSAARSVSVVRLFTRSGIPPSRMGAVGFGEFQPIADNKTEEGRSKNRRVVLVVLASDERHRVMTLTPEPTAVVPVPLADSPTEDATPSKTMESESNSAPKPLPRTNP